MNWNEIHSDVVKRLDNIEFSQPVFHVYNPLVYAMKNYEQYLDKFGSGETRLVFLGMNPGPFGMVQTGIPFGEVTAVKDFLKISDMTDEPAAQHPVRKIEGFNCRRSEVSGRRLWGFFQEKFDCSENMAGKVFVANYCPLAFLTERGSNITPDKLKKSEQRELYEVCDDLFKNTIRMLNPEVVIGIGNFAAECASRLITDSDCRILKIPHPSPANPRANKFWKQDTEEIIGNLLD
ncbi:single-stranded DNA-binding protein [Myxococcota bacterium]|nr:single-stranded DNA-binding protein [Myxococcota bacterium]MBU1381188.1 single-stranded DNA-binding protein [Myxococcota bacterium]MBU1496213.1 single-stranded DNA-binding protein [Myxococcota bacterium]